uniref:DNA-directed RNA polymerase n=1 Tax=viral metagenome TaxID=1070528 RepID=A0A6C0HI52_9ZZZZ
MSELDESTIWKILDTYFKDNPQALVRHHIDSYDDFFKNGLPQLFKEMNPLKIELDFDEATSTNRSKCYLYFGGKDVSRIFYGKPTLYEKQSAKYLFPNECRLKNMTYGMTVHFDIEIDIERTLEPGEEQLPVNVDNKLNLDENSDEDMPKAKKTPAESAKIKENMKNNMIAENVVLEHLTIKDIYLGRFPIMVKSHFCILNGMSSDMCFRLGECKHDRGGYFIIDGKEKTIVCQEKFGDNMIRIGKSTDDNYSYSLDIRSVSENTAKQSRSFSMKLVAPTKEYYNNNVVVFIPNVRKPVPLFILFRALGVLSDRDIISFCTLQNAEQVSPQFAEFFNACIHNAAGINTQRDALKFISLLVKQRNPKHSNTYNDENIAKVLQILADYVLPHVGEVDFITKAYHIGYMVNRLILVALEMEPPTDRDHYKFKRIETEGTMLKELFKEYYKKLHSNLRRDLETRYFYNKGIFKHPGNLFHNEVRPFLKERLVEIGVMKGFKGNWGSEAHTRRVGITQDLNRLSFNGMISHLRKTNLAIDNIKMVAPHLLHGSQWGYIDPLDTPDGGNIGLHKYMAIMAVVTPHTSRSDLQNWLIKHPSVRPLSSCVPFNLSRKTKVFLNGLWVGVTTDQKLLLGDLKSHRRHALIPVTTSIAFHVQKNIIEIFTDAGRLARPVFYFDQETEQFSFESKKEWNQIQKLLDSQSTTKLLTDESESTWSKLVSGLHDKKIKDFNPLNGKCYTWEELYNDSKIQLETNKALLEYIDSNETETSLICLNHETLKTNPFQKYTHMELHESTIFSVMSNLIIYPEHNPLARNCFSCGQSKQAVSLYHTNYQLRMDKTAVVLNNGQIPLVKSQYLQYLNQEEMPYGENAIVAIMCYTGYNVEDAILINEGALQRGLFRTTYFTTYEAHEEKEVKSDALITEKIFTNVSTDETVLNTSYGFDYNKLNEHGLIPENTPIDDKTILIGMSAFVPGKEFRKDISKKTKKGQVGIVDKSFMTEDKNGKRIAKVRIREERIPSFGDKFSSRAGQKGTIGMVVREQDMPFTSQGIRPDIIINPHALPSRMTIGQLIESVVGKACAINGSFGDCTAFRNKNSSKFAMFGELLSKYGFHSSGNELMYSGMTGQQLETEIFIGPTYYMRLKHMVKDKINFRARGPNTNLTKQPVSGRANDGGLRIGEMERDAVISHGMSAFLQESMTVRSDDYCMAVCNKTGTIAIYNPSKNLMFSPSADGPLRYNKSLTDQVEIEKVSKFGRNFSIVRVPYSLKLLMQELQAINIRVSIITEDNISQMDNMNFSHNIDLLLNTENATPQLVVAQIKQNLKDEPKMIPMKEVNRDRDSTEIKPRLYRSNDSWDDDDSIPVEKKGDDAHYQEWLRKGLGSDDEISLKTASPPFGYNPQTPSPPYDPRTAAPPTPPYDPKTAAPPTPPYDPRTASPPTPGTGSPYNPTGGVIVGGMVHHRADKKPSRCWIVEKETEDEVTIRTDDFEGLLPGENVKILNKNSIFPVDDSLIYMENKQIQQDLLPVMDNQKPMIRAPANTTDPKGGIVFAPVIKIINEGSDYSQDTKGQSQDEEHYFPENITVKPQQSLSQSQSQQPSPSFPENTVDLNKLTNDVVVKKEQ